MRLVPRLLVQSFGILALSASLALVANVLRPDGPAPVLAAPSAVQLDKSGGEIGIKDAALLFVTGRAVFLDARSQYEYSLSHVKGAISLPPVEFASQFQDLKPKLAGKEAVITYCDGELCPLSHKLAQHLRDAGVKNVYVL
jgi:predicted sulfurtransferase